jgi:hypothetical protein
VRALLRAAGLDPHYAGILSSAIGTLSESGFGVEANERAAHARRCLSRIMTRENILSQPQADELEVWLAGLAPAPARPSAEVHRFAG